MNVVYYSEDKELKKLLPGTAMIYIKTPDDVPVFNTRVKRAFATGKPVALVIDSNPVLLSSLFALDDLIQIIQNHKCTNITLAIKSICPVFPVMNTREIDMHGYIINDLDNSIIIEIGDRTTGMYNNFLEHVKSYVEYRDVSTIEWLLIVLSNHEFTPNAEAIFVILSMDEIKPNPDNLSGDLTPVTQAMVVLAINLFIMMFPKKFTCSGIFVSGTMKPENKQIFNAALKMYGNRVESVYASSILKRDLSKDMLARMEECWNFVEKAYGGSIVIDREMYEFKDVVAEQATGKTQQWKPINAVAKKSILRRVPEKDRERVERCVSFLLSKRRDVEEKSSTLQESTIKRIASSLATRRNLLDIDVYNRARIVTESIVGNYPVSKDIVMVISNDPVDILRKSTGQDWEETSCEKSGGMHFEGVFSDILFGNLVAFMRDANTGHDIARIMLRWCVDDAGKIGIGIESRWYYSTGIGTGSKCPFISQQIVAYSITATQATRMVIDILKNRGVYSYQTCTTPYPYGGYSDYIKSSNNPILYNNADKDIPKFG